MVLVVKNPPANAGDIRDMGLIPGSGSSSGEEHGNPLQYSCLKNLLDRGAWRATVHTITTVAKSRTQLKQLSMHAYVCVYVHIIYYIFFIANNAAVNIGVQTPF